MNSKNIFIFLIGLLIGLIIDVQYWASILDNYLAWVILGLLGLISIISIICFISLRFIFRKVDSASPFNGLNS